MLLELPTALTAMRRLYFPLRPIWETRFPWLSNLEEKNAIQVFPNPSSDWIWVRIPENWAGEKQIQLMDLLGRKLLEVEANANNPTAVDIQGIPAGNYLLTVKSDDSIHGFD